MSEERQDGARRRRPGRRTYSAEKARQGEIILRKPWERAVFIAGLAGGVILLLVLGVLSAR